MCSVFVNKGFSVFVDKVYSVLNKGYSIGGI